MTMLIYEDNEQINAEKSISANVSRPYTENNQGVSKNGSKRLYETTLYTGGARNE